MTVDIFETFVTEFNLTLVSKINNVVDLGDSQYEITVCDTLHLRQYSIITIDGNDYTVNSVSGKVVTITGDVLPVAGLNYKGPDLFYFHGTPIQTGAELNQIPDSNNKTPMIYFFEVLSEDLDLDKGSSIDRRSVILLLFLDQANYSDWTTDEHYSAAIKPMANITRKFIDFIREHRLISKLEFDTSEIRYHAKHSLTVSINGHDGNLFSQPLSGTELRMNLPIKKDLTCNPSC